MAIDTSVWREKSVTPSEALEIAEISFGESAMTALMDYLSGGMIIGVSERSSLFAQHENTQTFDDPMPVEEEWWTHLQMPAQFWKTGHARFSIPRTIAGFDGPPLQIVCSGVRLDRGQIERYFPVPKRPQSEPPTMEKPVSQVNKGGAPRKDIWDDLLIAMFERLWVENWQPKSQGEIERAMLDWVALKGFELGPTSVKKPAKKLFLLSKK